MRVIFDQATPLPIRPYLEGHWVRTAAQQGWDTLRNGDLLTVAEEAGFDVLLTTDKNMRYQQNLAARKLPQQPAGGFAADCVEMASTRLSAFARPPTFISMASGSLLPVVG
jgi:hypothetical protein